MQRQSLGYLENAVETLIHAPLIDDSRKQSIRTVVDDSDRSTVFVERRRDIEYMDQGGERDEQPHLAIVLSRAESGRNPVP